MITVGRLCMKIAGRDAGKKCVVVEELGKGNVLIDGETRRRKCNVRHLEPLAETLSLKAKASHEEVVAAFKGLGITLVETKPKQKAEKPKTVRHQHNKAKPEPKPKAEKKAKPAKKEAPATTEKKAAKSVEELPTKETEKAQ